MTAPPTHVRRKIVRDARIYCQNQGKRPICCSVDCIHNSGPYQYSVSAVISKDNGLPHLNSKALKLHMGSE